MNVNGYAILDLFVTAVRLLLAAGVVVGGIAAWWSWGRLQRVAPDAEVRARRDDRSYLLFLGAFVLLLLNVVAWPLFYVVMTSYIPQWPGVMCLYGVTQIGEGSIGTSRHLPWLVAVIEVARPAVVFAAGAWLLMYFVNRRTATGALGRRVLVGVIAAGLLSAVDAAAEAAYLTIDKKEKYLSAGCCTAARPDRKVGGLVAAAWGAAPSPARLSAAHLAAQAGMIAVVGGCIAFPARMRSRSVLIVLGLAGGAALAAGMAFLAHVAAPRLLGLPHHRCLYCLFTQVPESLVAALFLVGGTCAVGWAGVLTAAMRSPETVPFLDGWVDRLLRAGWWCYVASIAMLGLQWALAP
jgi:hypothetical protein